MLLEKFIQTLKAKDRRKNTLDLLKYSIILCENWLNKPLEDATQEDIFRFIEHIKANGLVMKSKNRKEPLSKGSLFIIESRLIQFYTFCFDETDDPKYHKMVKKLKGIKVDQPKNNIRPQDILFPEDIKKLINVATLERDRCLIAVLYESGLRLGELRALKNDLVEMNEHTQEVTFHIPNQEGCKTGSRSVLCLEVYGYVQDWVKCNADNRFIPLSEAGIQKILNRLFHRAGINKPSNPHMFRHSSITNAVIMKMQPNQISMRYWGIPNSNMLSIYLHLSEQIVNSGYRDAKGMGNGNSNTVINPLASRCVNCGRLIQSGNLCKTCGDSKRLSEENETLKDRMAQRDAEIQKISTRLDKYDALFDSIDSRADENIEIISKNPGLLTALKGGTVIKKEKVNENEDIVTMVIPIVARMCKKEPA
ncbi:tyrosine-type recombinase/integrase [Patescibacteria group bacterium]|nr:tyrosine-type recombinase/integrase [Patescibacteria group bacterium]